MRRICPTAQALAATVLMLGIGRCVEAEPYTATVVMQGLSNPRGLSFGPDGALYVAEAGTGGGGPSIPLNNGQVASYGASGGVSRLSDGQQRRVLTGLPSLAPAGGGEATGLQDIVFTASGEAYGVIGLGADPAARAGLGREGDPFGSLARLDFAGNTFQVLADLARFELANDTDGKPDSNPFGLAALPGGGFAVADAGANAVRGVSAGGTIETLAVLPDRPNPLPFGPPAFEAVPTSVALGLDGVIHIGGLTGFPFPAGAAEVLRLESGSLAAAFGDFTTITDLAFGPDGSLYVLELSKDLLAAPAPASGALIRVDPRTGARTTILDDGLVFPTGVAVGPDGSVYVSHLGTSPDGGQVLRLTTAVPEPGSLALLGLGVPALAAWALRRRGR